MPQNGMSYEGRRGGTRHNTCKANTQVPGTALVNGAVAHNGWPAAATKTSEDTPNGTKPQCMVNGYINHGCKGKSTKAAPQRTHRKHGNTISAVSDASAAGGISSADSPGGVSVNRATSLDTGAPPSNSEQMAPQRILSATAKNQRRRLKLHKKRNTAVVRPENPELPPLPPCKEEDWESEIQEVKLTDWEKISFGVNPYGPEDVLHFSLRDLTLKQRDTADLPVTANYSPAVHHQRPIRWCSYNTPTEAGQFADADE